MTPKEELTKKIENIGETKKWKDVIHPPVESEYAKLKDEYDKLKSSRLPLFGRQKIYAHLETLLADLKKYDGLAVSTVIDYDYYEHPIMGHRLSKNGLNFFEQNCANGEDSLKYINPQRLDANLKQEIATYYPSYLRYSEFHDLDPVMKMRILRFQYSTNMLQKDVKDLLRDGILDSIPYNSSTLNTVFPFDSDPVLTNYEAWGMAEYNEHGMEYIGIKNIPDELLKWIIDNEKKNPCLEGQLLASIVSAVELSKKGIDSEAMLKRIADISNLMGVIYPERDMKALETKIWQEELDPGKNVAPEIVNRLKELGTDYEETLIKGHLQTLEQKMMNFARISHLAATNKGVDFREIQSGHHRINQDVKVAEIFLNAVPKDTVEAHVFYNFFSTEISLTDSPRSTWGSVFRLSQLSQEQINSWMLEQLESRKDQVYVIDTTSLKTEKLPEDIHPYKTAQRNWEQRTNDEQPKNILQISAAERERIEKDVRDSRELDGHRYEPDVEFFEPER